MKYIDANVLSDLIRTEKGNIGDTAMSYFLDLIDDAPAADVTLVQRGKWQEIKFGDGIYDYRFRCMNCKGETPNHAYVIAPDFCPHCGAKMEVEGRNGI